MRERETGADGRQTFVFVYGTLMRGEINHHWLDGAYLVAERAWVRGMLFDTGKGYPALVSDASAHRVCGELYEVDVRTLSLLDELENHYGTGDPRNEYERVRTAVRQEKETGDGRERGECQERGERQEREQKQEREREQKQEREQEREQKQEREQEREQKQERERGQEREREREAWTYVYSAAAARECRPIFSGDWRLREARE